MHIRWWQSIRWKMVLGSMLLALLATSLLALTALLVINYYYGVDQQNSLKDVASDKAMHSGEYFAQATSTTNRNTRLHNAVQRAIGTTSTMNQQLIFIAFNENFIPIYTSFKLPSNAAIANAYLTPTARPPVTPGALPTPVARATVTAQQAANARRARNAVDTTLLLINPALKTSDMNKFQQSITRALYQQHSATDDQLGHDGPVGQAQPYSVRPVSDGSRFVGALVVTIRPEIIPPFVSTVALAVFPASFVIALLAALAAILFSRTITRPLGKLTNATRSLALGDYSAQVTIKAPGELGELAHNFNNMASQLKRDVEELQRQEIWRRELIMNITHDLATPLTAIAGLGESLMDGVNQSREDYEATGRIIMHETLRLRRLVQDLHVMAKVEARALQPQLKPLRMAALVDEILAVQAPEFERHHVEPINAISYHLPMVQGDADMLMRVFSNMCNNSLRHTPAGGTVTIDAIVIENRMVVSFTDTGEGIPEDALPRIFERFYRADSARQSSTGGSGLGLAIMNAIIEAHGGTVWAENIAGAGARICFALPLSTNNQLSLSEMPTLPLLHKGIHSARLTKLDVEK